ncbi:MAG: NAD-dependent epimerase/dehydratase family protein [Thiotrichales bacterium]|nr:NAD-dependent epimerase/dehydratase family protein [Thiotrichales bacterium]
MKVAVIGASGFIGSHLLSRLREGPHEISATSRTGHPHVPGIEWSVLDLTASQSDFSMLDDTVDAIVHLASLAHDEHGSSINYRAVNVEGTKRLLSACTKAGVKRFVYLSSVKVLGDGNLYPDESIYTDDSIPAPNGIYGQTKLEAEHLVQEFCRNAGLDFVILRPPLVYGPGVKANFRALLGIVRNSWPLPLGNIKNKRSLIFVGNLCDAIVKCLEYENSINDTFLVSDDCVSTPELISEIASHMQLTARLFHCPLNVLRGLAWLSGKSAVLHRLAGSLIADSSRFNNYFSWIPRHSFSSGIEQTVKWYTSELNGTKQ